MSNHVAGKSFGEAATPSSPDPHGASLLPTFGLFTTTMLVVGAVIGSGIFRKSGVMMGQLGSSELLLAVWVLAGAITLIGALTNAEISSFIPETGGQYIFFERMYGPFTAYVYGWSVFAVYKTGSIAALAYVFAEYFGQLVPLPELSAATANIGFHMPFIGDIAPFKEIGVKCVAVSVIVVLTTVNYLGVRFGGLVQNFFTVAKIAGMAGLFFAVFLVPDTGGSFANLTSTAPALQKHGLALAIAIAAALQGAFWAYDGWVNTTYFAGEVRDSSRIVPRATVLGMFIVTGIYLAMNFAYCWLLPADVMAQSKLVAGDVADRVMSGGGKWIALVVMISTFGANNGTVLASARVYFAMARRNVFPAFLGRAHPRFHTPSASLVVQSVWSIALVFSGTFDTLTDMLMFVSWIFYGIGAYGVFVLRRKEPDAPRSYKVPGYPWMPAIFVAFTAVFLVLTVMNDITNYRAAVAAGQPAIINCALGAALVAIGIPIYFYYRRHQEAPSPAG